GDGQRQDRGHCRGQPADADQAGRYSRRQRHGQGAGRGFGGRTKIYQRRKPRAEGQVSQDLMPPCQSRDLLIVNKRGLHARASAKFVQTVSLFDATVTVSKDGTTVGGTSIMGLMMLAASTGCSIEVSASGAQANEALDALASLVADKFGEDA